MQHVSPAAIVAAPSRHRGMLRRFQRGARLPGMAVDIPVLTVPDVAAWGRWLEDHEGQRDGIWLTLARKGTTEPTSLTYGDALAEALCHGWIDGQLGA